MEENHVDIISNVPEYVALIILNFLDVQDLIKCEKCCHLWKNLARDNFIWRRKCRQNNFREIPENERSENYVKFCREFSSHHWKGVFMYHHNLRKNWLKKMPSVDLNHLKKQNKIFYFHHIDDKILVMQVSDLSIRIFNSSTRKILKILQGHSHCVSELKICGNTLVSTCMDFTLKAWNIDQEICVQSKWLDCDSVKFDLSNGRVASGTNNSRIIEVWNAETGEVLFSIDNQNCTSCIVIQGGSILTGCVNGMVRIYSLVDGTLQNCIQNQFGEIKQIMANGLPVISVLQNVCLKILDTANGSLLHTAKPRSNILPITVNGNRIAWASSKSTIQIWDILKGATIRTIEHDKLIVAITTNEDFLFCVDEDNMVVMWDLNTGELKRSFVIYTNRKVLSVHFFKVSRTKLALHTAGFIENTILSIEKFLCDFDVQL